jgi:outer membrane protein assembly factor BamB
MLQLAAMYGPSTVLWLQGEPALAHASGPVETSIIDNPQVVLFAKMLGPLVGTALLLVWWVCFSRASWSARLLGPVVFVVVGWVTLQAMHATMSLGFLLYAIPTATAAALVALMLFRETPFTRRGIIALCSIAVGFGCWTLVRLDGVESNLSAELSWRWAQTREQDYLARRANQAQNAAAPALANLAVSESDWPEFRGPDRDGCVTATTIKADWEPNGLPELWRTQIGPGWSSFCVVGERIFTQEQRGDHEVVTAYDASTGVEVWEHQDETRFVEMISGVGPRATPTFADGRLYTTGANGAINCLDPQTGDVIWSRDLVEDTGAPVPMWGFASSPLIHDGLAIIGSAAGLGKTLIAFDIQNGDVRWTSGDGIFSYSSPHLATLHGIPQVLLMTELGLASFAPKTGEQLWLHAWPLGGGSARIVQPAVTGSDIVIGTGYGIGTRRITVLYEDGNWSTEELWTSRALKPYFNDFVIDGDYAFGFDGNIFTCIDLKTGDRVWKRGRYGSGQVLMVVDQKLLVVLSEQGELVLLAANPEQHTELHRFPAIEGKTWNHPVIANGRLFVRNGVVAACFDVAE